MKAPASRPSSQSVWLDTDIGDDTDDILALGLICARREYIEWITEAKREETRSSRLSTAVKWIAGGKKRNWKYENC